MSAEQDTNERKTLYLESLALIERLHRRMLDLIKAELDQSGREEINAVQALLLYNIGEDELTAGELMTRGYYLGSNVSYNLKKLVENGLIDHQRSTRDRRAVRIKLTEEGKAIAGLVEVLYDRQVANLARRPGLDDQGLDNLNGGLRALELFWSEKLPRRR
ncbi:MarR family winged helix-turn-helix transcriptional regulator [Zavarzinia sp. CC-PAN008]|uniref:MarR family winged helix-turn-helix transcriptional regulator n=1 Tax=Zavarzinia sp. CC-PAN008 TaxID=3243332 RepID=UPI003F743459